MHFLIVIMPEKGRYIKNGGIEVYIIPDCSILKRAKYAKKEVKKGTLAQCHNMRHQFIEKFGKNVHNSYCGQGEVHEWDEGA